MAVFIKLFFIFFVFSTICFSQNTSLSIVGEIKSTSDEAIENADVFWVTNNKINSKTKTNFDGSFILKSLVSQKGKFIVRSLGYKEYTKEINLIKNVNLNAVKIQLNLISLPSIEIIGAKKTDYKSLCGTATKISTKQLQQIAPIGTQEALEYVPGINGFADDGIGNSRVSIGIRGINPRRSSRTLVLEDGIPVQPALYVYSSMYYNPPIERINEIEVIKSSSSILYGPHTMGGVVNYITNRPREEFGGKVNFTGGTNRYLSSLIEVGGFGNKKFRPEFQLLYKSGDGFRQNNAFEQFNGTFKMMFVPSEKRKIYLNINANHEKSNATYTGLTEYSYANDYRFNPKNNDEFTVQRYALNIIQQRKLKGKWQENTKVYFNYFDRDWWREFDVFTSAADYEDGSFTEIPLAESGSVDDLIRVGGGQSNFGILRTFMVAGVDHQYLWKHQFGDSVKGNLKLGGRIHFERFLDNAGIGDAPDARTGVYYRANNYETYSYAFFARENIDFGNFVLSPGLRFEVFEQEMVNRLNGNELSDYTTLALLPGIGFNYKWDIMNFFGGIHRGFTPPSNGTLLLLNFGETDNTNYSDLTLKSETSLNYELGFRFSNKYISGEMTGFYISIKDMIAAARGTSFTNLGMVSSSGLESSMQLKLSSFNEWLPNFFGTYTYLTTEIHDGILSRSAINDSIVPDVSGNQLPYAPNHNLILGLTYNIKKAVEIMFNYKYVSRSYSDYENIEYSFNRGDTGPIPNYWLFNASINVTFKKDFRFFVSAKNIFDKKYIGSRLHSNPGQKYASSSSGILPGLGRQVNIGFTYNF